MAPEVVERAVESRSESMGLRVRHLLGNQQVILFLVLVAMVAFFTQQESIFFSKGVFANILNDWAPIVLIAVGEMYVIVSGGIDLSVGSNISLSGVVAALAMRGLTRGEHGEDFTLFVGVLVAVGTGAGVGVVNALLIQKARIVPFVATLATLGVARGLALVLTEGGPIGGGPPDTVFWVVPRVWAFSKPVLIVIVLLAILGLFLHLSRFGRYTFAIGSNPFAARAAGINVERHVFKVYVLSGALAGLAGMFYYLRLGSGAPAVSPSRAESVASRVPSLVRWCSPP
jgi:ribose transport system permease protein